MPIVQGFWTRASSNEEKSRLVTKVLNSSATTLYVLGWLLLLIADLSELALLVYGAGLLLQIAAFLREDRAVKGAILSLVVCSVIYASLIQFHFLGLVLDNQSQLIEALEGIIDSLSNSASVPEP
jgi:branched-subunit amino acid transport protein AzlD